MSPHDHTDHHTNHDPRPHTGAEVHPLLNLVGALATMAAQAGPGLPNLLVGVVGPVHAVERELVVCRLPAQHQVLRLTRAPAHWTGVICVFGGAGAVGVDRSGTTAYVLRTPMGIIERCTTGAQQP